MGLDIPPADKMIMLLKCSDLGKGIPHFELEYKFRKNRKWRFDLAWPQEEYRVAVEVDGGIYSRGRHTRGKGFTDDCEKLNAAAEDGWTVLRFTGEMIANDSQKCIKQLRRVLEGKM